MTIALIINACYFNIVEYRIAYSSSAISISMCMLHSSVLGLACKEQNFWQQILLKPAYKNIQVHQICCLTYLLDAKIKKWIAIHRQMIEKLNQK